MVLEDLLKPFWVWRQKDVSPRAQANIAKALGETSAAHSKHRRANRHSDIRMHAHTQTNRWRPGQNHARIH